MGLQIVDDYSCIKIVNNGDVLHVNKKLVKTIDILQNDTVRINIGEGILHHIYIKLSEVTQPAGMPDVATLRDVIKHMLDADDGQADPTLENQIAEINLVTQIKETQEIHTGLMTTIKQILTEIQNFVNPATSEPARIDESVPEKSYYGYAMPGANPAQAVWAIKRGSRINGITVYRWAEGNQDFAHIWDNRGALNYQPLL